jgi:hypothetical protein
LRSGEIFFEFVPPGVPSDPIREIVIEEPDLKGFTAP